MSRLREILLAFWFLTYCTHSNASIEDQDWQSFLNESCQVTIRGHAKKILGELKFWSHVVVSMDSWATNMSIEKPENDCQIQILSTKDPIRFQQCMAFYKAKWQWFARCKPVAVSACRHAGGFC